MSDLIDKESVSEQIHTFQITVMVRYAGCGSIGWSSNPQEFGGK